MRLRKLSIILCLVAIVFSGCKKETETPTTDNEPTKEVQVTKEEEGNLEEVTVKEEPTLSEAAKKLTQFKEVKKGDTIAEFVVKDYGTITIKLFEKYAPKAVENFTTHAKEGYYDGVTFHRVIEEFMIQGGDPSGDGTGGQSIWEEPFEDEFTDELKPVRGALCMANAGANTNGSQFFIIQADADSVQNLEYLVQERYERSLIDYVQEGYGVSISESDLEAYTTYGGTPWLQGKHTVFGQVMDGFDVLDAIASTKLLEGSSIPVEEVIIETIRIQEQE